MIFYFELFSQQISIYHSRHTIIRNLSKLQLKKIGSSARLKDLSDSRPGRPDHLQPQAHPACGPGRCIPLLPTTNHTRLEMLLMSKATTDGNEKQHSRYCSDLLESCFSRAMFSTQQSSVLLITQNCIFIAYSTWVVFVRLLH